MDRSGAELDHRPYRTGDIERAAPAGIDVHQHRKIGGVGDAPYIGQHVVHGADAEVRDPERTGCHATARNIDRLEARMFGEPRSIGIDRAHDLERPFLFHCCPEPYPGRAVYRHS